MFFEAAHFETPIWGTTLAIFFILELSARGIFDGDDALPIYGGEVNLHNGKGNKNNQKPWYCLASAFMIEFGMCGAKYFIFTTSSFQLMVNWWFGARWFGIRIGVPGTPK